MQAGITANQRKGGIVSDEKPNRPGVQSPVPGPTSPRIVDAQGRFQGNHEIWIEHAGICYRLRITRRNRLVLQK
jgi:hemin uptake protein HemP